MNLHKFICLSGFIGTSFFSLAEPATKVGEEASAPKVDIAANPVLEIENALNILEGIKEIPDEHKSVSSTWKFTLLQWKKLAKAESYSSISIDTYLTRYDPLLISNEFGASVLKIGASVSKEHSRTVNEWLKKGEALYEKVGERLRKAKRPEELDDILVKLTELSERPNYQSQNSYKSKEINSLTGKLQGSVQIVSKWQDYLIADNQRNAKACRSALQNISSSLSRNPIIPRSYVLRLLNPELPSQESRSEEEEQLEADITPSHQPLSFAEIIENYRKDLNTSQALDSLRLLPSAQLSDRGVKKALENFTIFAEVEKLAPTASFTELIELANKLRMKERDTPLFFRPALDKLLTRALKKEFNLSSSGGTSSPFVLLENEIETAAKNENWFHMGKLLEAYKHLGKTVINYQLYKYDEDATEIIQHLMLGKKSEELDDVRNAVIHYRAASTKSRSLFLAGLGFDQLKKIKTKQGDKFNQLLQEADLDQELKRMERIKNLDLREQYSKERGRYSRYSRSEENQDISSNLKKYIDQIVEKRLDAVQKSSVDKALKLEKEFEKPDAQTAE